MAAVVVSNGCSPQGAIFAYVRRPILELRLSDNICSIVVNGFPHRPQEQRPNVQAALSPSPNEHLLF